MRLGWSSKTQQRTIDSVAASVKRLERVGRMVPIPLSNLAVASDLKTRGAQVSFQVRSMEGVDSFILLRNFSRDPGSAKVIHTWPAASLKTSPQAATIALRYADADQDIAGKVAYYWVKAIPVSLKTQSNVFLSGAQKFDASLLPTAKQITGDYAISQAYTPTTQPLTAVTGGAPNQATVPVASFQVQYPFGAVNYNSGSITPLLDSTLYYIYCDDPTYKGGAQTYIASTSNPTVTAFNHRLYLGSVTTPAFGGAPTGGGGGGGGPCFSGNTLIKMRQGSARIEEIQPGEFVESLAGWVKVLARLEHWYEGPMQAMGFGEFVTPEHRIWHDTGWVQARLIWTDSHPFKGNVFNLALEGVGDFEHCYRLMNGRVAHNVRK